MLRIRATIPEIPNPTAPMLEWSLNEPLSRYALRITFHLFVRCTFFFGQTKGDYL